VRTLAIIGCGLPIGTIIKSPKSLLARLETQLIA